MVQDRKLGCDGWGSSAAGERVVRSLTEKLT
jgi:hypothetical protein